MSNVVKVLKAEIARISKKEGELLRRRGRDPEHESKMPSDTR